MLAIYVFKWWLVEVWFYEIANIFDYVFRIIQTVFGIIPTLLLLVIDIILSPIEIIGIVSYFIYKKKN